MNQTIENIKAIRKKLSIRPSIMADEFGIDRSFYSRWEKTGKKIDGDFLIFCAEKFEMSMDEIVNFHLTDQELSNTKKVKEQSPFLIQSYRNNIVNRKNKMLEQNIEQLEYLLDAAQNLIKRLQQENKDLRGLKKETN